MPTIRWLAREVDLELDPVGVLRDLPAILEGLDRPDDLELRKRLQSPDARESPESAVSPGPPGPPGPPEPREARGPSVQADPPPTDWTWPRATFTYGGHAEPPEYGALRPGEASGWETVVGIGAVAVIGASGANRLSVLRERSRAYRFEPIDSVGPGPVWLGGFGFDPGDPWETHLTLPAADRETRGSKDSGAADSEMGDWAGFPEALFFVPRVLLARGPRRVGGDAADRLGRAGAAAWRLLVLGPGNASGADLRALADLCEARLEERAETAAPEHPVDAAPRPPVAQMPTSGQLKGIVSLALEAIEAGAVRKAVVAAQARVADGPTPLDVLARLQRESSASGDGEEWRGTASFAFAPNPAAWLVGATPELLAEVEGNRVRTIALAGTTRRDTDDATDRALGRSLLASDKDRAEQSLVTDDIVRRLGDVPEVDSGTVKVDGPELRRLPHLQHLQSTIEATAVDPIHILRVAQAVHPTPALAGTPRDAALAAIRHIEAQPRGWYGGAVGYFDGEGNGRLHVVIRSGLWQRAAGSHQWLIQAGAGIVAASTPAAEAAEMRLKLERTIVGLLGQAADVSSRDHLTGFQPAADSLV